MALKYINSVLYVKNENNSRKHKISFQGHENEYQDEIYNNMLTEDQKLKFIYLKSLCHWQLNEQDLAVKEYSYLAWFNQKLQKDSLARFAWGVVLLPL